MGERQLRDHSMTSNERGGKRRGVLDKKKKKKKAVRPWTALSCGSAVAAVGQRIKSVHHHTSQQSVAMSRL